MHVLRHSPLLGILLYTAAGLAFGQTTETVDAPLNSGQIKAKYAPVQLALVSPPGAAMERAGFASGFREFFARARPEARLTEVTLVPFTAKAFADLASELLSREISGAVLPSRLPPGCDPTLNRLSKHGVRIVSLGYQAEAEVLIDTEALLAEALEIFGESSAKQGAIFYATRPPDSQATPALAAELGKTLRAKSDHSEAGSEVLLDVEQLAHGPSFAEASDAWEAFRRLDAESFRYDKQARKLLFLSDALFRVGPERFHESSASPVLVVGSTFTLPAYLRAGKVDRVLLPAFDRYGWEAARVLNKKLGTAFAAPETVLPISQRHGSSESDGQLELLVSFDGAEGALALENILRAWSP